MPRKPKFRPEIRRIILNPEQAVLSCSCYSTSRIFNNNAYHQTEPAVGDHNVCHSSGARVTGWSSDCQASGPFVASYSIVSSSSSS